MSSYEVTRHHRLRQVAFEAVLIGYPTILEVSMPIWTKLEAIAFWGDVKVGLEVAQTNEQRKQLLEFAILFDDLPFVERLLQPGIGLNDAMRKAVEYDCLYVAEYLLTKRNVSTEIRMVEDEKHTGKFRTLLEYAAESGYVQMVRLLVLHGAQVPIRAMELVCGYGNGRAGHRGLSARRCASQKAVIETLRFLELHGPKPYETMWTTLISCTVVSNAKELLMYLWRKQYGIEPIPAAHEDFLLQWRQQAERSKAVECLEFLNDPQAAFLEQEKQQHAEQQFALEKKKCGFT